MRKKIRKAIINFRGFKVTKKELITDLIFLAISFLISLTALFIFDVHWRMYPGETLIPPSRWVGITKDVYLIGSLIGTIAGFFIIKLFLLAAKEELK